MHNTPHTEEAKQKIREKQKAWRKTKRYELFVERQRKRAKKSPTKFKKGHESFTDGANLIGQQAGDTHWNWHGGITPEAIRVRGTAAYIKWRKDIYNRDDYTCQSCKKRGGYLEADHYPIPFTVLFAKKDWKTMWDINNGRTLCRSCHDKTKQHWRKYYDKTTYTLLG